VSQIRKKKRRNLDTVVEFFPPPISQHKKIHPLTYHFSLIKSVSQAKASANFFFLVCTFVILENNIHMYKELNVAVDFSL